MRLKLALLATVLAVPAFAADMPQYEPMGAYAPLETFDWTGFYAGVHVGYGWADAEVDGFDALSGALIGETDFDADGVLGGVQAGYNFQTGAFVLGLEGDFSFSGVEGDSLTLNPGLGGDVLTEVELNWLATIRGRAGFAFDRTLIYATGGLAIGEVGLSVDTPIFTESDDETYLGYAVGAGIEHAFTDSLSAKIEYLYVDLGEETYVSAVAPLESDVDLTIHTVKAGLNYRF